MGRDKVKRDKKSKKDKSRHDKVSRKDRSRRKDGKRHHGKRRSPTPESEGEYSYSYYSYSESRSPSRAREKKGRDRDRPRDRDRDRDRGRSPPRRSRSPRRCDRYSPPPRRAQEPSPKRRFGGGGYIPVPGPRSPSRDGSPPNDYIYNRLIDREKARIKRDFAEADKIRDELRQRGVDILERERRWEHKDGRSGARPNAEDKKRGE